MDSLTWRSMSRCLPGCTGHNNNHQIVTEQKDTDKKKDNPIIAKSKIKTSDGDLTGENISKGKGTRVSVHRRNGIMYCGFKQTNEQTNTSHFSELQR